MDNIDESIIEEDVMNLRETMQVITNRMEKIDIVKRILKIISDDQYHTKENGIIIARNEVRTLRYYIPTRELYSYENGKRTLIAELYRKDNELILIDVVSELELILILNELECGAFKTKTMFIQ